MLASDVARRVGDRAIAQRGHQDLVSGHERQRAQHRVGTGRRVVDEDQVLAARAEEGRHLRRRGAQARRLGTRRADADLGELAQEVARGLQLDLVADRLLHRQHAARRRPTVP